MFQYYCNLAMADIRHGQYEMAVRELKIALKLAPTWRAWSKLMLALRELGRNAPNGQ